MMRQEEYPSSCHSAESRSPFTGMAALVNKFSGERNAATFIKEELEHWLTPERVFDLFPYPDLPPAIEEAKAFVKHLVPDVLIVAGGDGTVSLAMDIVDSIRSESLLGPPIAILPMGTGNDLSRSLGFGGGYIKPTINAVENFKKLLYKTSSGTPISVDRFCVTMSLMKSSNGESLSSTLVQPLSVPFTNYFSIGFDAKIARNFNEFRHKHPTACHSRTMNKVWYGCIGCESICTFSTFSPKRTCIMIDGKPVKEPSDSKAIVVCNVITYAAGNILWEDTRKKFSPVSLNDGLVEVCSLTGPWHIVGIATHTRKAKKLGQGKAVDIVVSADYCAQYDGEPIEPLGGKNQSVSIAIRRVGQSLGMVPNEQVTSSREER